MTVHELLTEVASCASCEIPEFLKDRMTRRETSFDYSPKFSDLDIDARFANVTATVPALVNDQGVQVFA